MTYGGQMAMSLNVPPDSVPARTRRARLLVPALRLRLGEVEHPPLRDLARECLEPPPLLKLRARLRDAGSAGLGQLRDPLFDVLGRGAQLLRVRDPLDRDQALDRDFGVGTDL